MHLLPGQQVVESVAAVVKAEADLVPWAGFLDWSPLPSPQEAVSLSSPDHEANFLFQPRVQFFCLLSLWSEG